ncbi:MAG TPA: hypothetical protein PKY34_05150, partial [Ruminococcus sp.]|nr:hypothetical protein [Ruminococcus sp.]
MLTATPINNSFLDLQHLIELFTHRQEDYFSAAPLGIHSLAGHFKKKEKQLDQVSGTAISDSLDISGDIIRADKLVTELVVQRSRAYVKRSLLTEQGNNVLFSERKPPTVANYSLEKSYGRLIKDFKESFDRKDKNGKTITILSLAIYSPYSDDYFIGDKSKMDEMVTGRQQQVVNLIRILLLKRFESSIEAFKETCIKIYIRLNKFLNDYKDVDASSKRRVERKQAEQEEILRYAEEYAALNQTSIEDIEDSLPDYVWNTQEVFDVNDFDINALLVDTMMDMDTLSKFIEDMMEFKPENDDKIRELKHMSYSWGALSGAFLGPFLFGLFMKKASRAACWTSFITGVGISVAHMLLFSLNIEAFSGIRQAVIDLNCPLNLLSPINAGAFAMIVSLIIVPIVSSFTKAPEKKIVDNAFSSLATK